jgi:hypothetical protein
MNTTPFAEIIESSLHSFTAQSWQWDKFAHFGSLVKVDSGTKQIFAVVHQVQTGSMDPNRTPFVYQKTEQELLKEQPQIFSFLKTTFSCLILGYQEKGNIQYTISPEPPKIHAFVSPMDTDSLKTFFYQDTYLHTLFNAADQIYNLDELLLALFKQQKELDILNKTKLHQLIETFSILSGNDYRRLKLFLQRVQPIVQNR